MTVMGFVLISCESGFERKVMEKLSGVSEVIEANRLSGMYDVIVKIESTTPEKLRELIIWKICKIDKIRSFVPLVGHEPVNFLVN